MERYNRAYRDSKSPLTPLTPLAHQNVFNFRLATDSHFTKRSSPKGKSPTLPQRYSEKFLKVRSVFEHKEKREVTVTRSANYLKVPAAARSKRYRAQSKSQKQRQKSPKINITGPSSPIAPKPLSPRTSDLLAKVGMIKYRSLFEREEIDIQVLRILTAQDLIYLGITCSADQQELLKAIEFASEFY